MFFTARRHTAVTLRVYIEKKTWKEDCSIRIRFYRREEDSKKSGDASAVVLKKKKKIFSLKPCAAPSGVQEASTDLRATIRKYCLAFDVSFREFLDTLQGDGASLKVALFVADPVYKLRREFRRSGPVCKFLSKQNITVMLKLFRDVMKLERADMYFAPTSHSPSRQMLLKNKWKLFLNHWIAPQQIIILKRVCSIAISKALFLFARKKKFRNFRRSPFITSKWRRTPSISSDRDLALTRTSNLHKITPLLRMWRIFILATNVVLRIFRLTFCEMAFDLKESVSEVCAEQQSVTVMRHILRKFTKDGDMVFDACMGTGSTAKVCLLMPNHQNFILCDSDIKCI